MADVTGSIFGIGNPLLDIQLDASDADFERYETDFLGVSRRRRPFPLSPSDFASSTHLTLPFTSLTHRGRPRPNAQFLLCTSGVIFLVSAP